MHMFRTCALKHGNRGKAASIYLSQWANRTSVKIERRRKTPGNHRNFPSSFCFITVYLKIKQEAPFLLPFTAHIAVYDPYLHKSKWQYHKSLFFFKR